jgi:predicted ATP-binding protein involved in virulence
VMLLYVEDTDSKLSVLGDLAKRSALLLDRLNEKLKPRKKILLDREKGLVAQDHNNRQLALDALSSGEQHELVMHYDLLFRIRPNTLVLIDEPELSLHVDWQKRFLPDLIQVIQLANFDAVLATHSPYIVGDFTDLMIPLGADSNG